MSCYDRTYPVFKEGDEVYTEHKSFKAITQKKTYVVKRCYKPPGYIKGYPVVMIELVTDIGFTSVYATEKFLKTKKQIRKDKFLKIV